MEHNEQKKEIAIKIKEKIKELEPLILEARNMNLDVNFDWNEAREHSGKIIDICMNVNITENIQF